MNTLKDTLNATILILFASAVLISFGPMILIYDAVLRIVNWCDTRTDRQKWLAGEVLQ